MANKKTRAVSKEEFELIVATIRSGFTTANGERVRPNDRIATCIIIESNLGMRIGDIVKLRLTDIIYESGRYHLNRIIEEKTNKVRAFSIPTEIYIFLQEYALRNGIKPEQRLFDISVRTVQNHIQLVSEYLGLVGIGSHSFRKYFADTIFLANDYNIELTRHLLNHSSVNITQRYISLEPKFVEQALQKHIIIPA